MPFEDWRGSPAAAAKQLFRNHSSMNGVVSSV